MHSEGTCVKDAVRSEKDNTPSNVYILLVALLVMRVNFGQIAHHLYARSTMVLNQYY